MRNSQVFFFSVQTPFKKATQCSDETLFSGRNGFFEKTNPRRFLKLPSASYATARVASVRIPIGTDK